MRREVFHKFQTENNRYIYDKYSNHIIKVSEILYKMLDFHESNLETITKTFQKNHQKDEIEKAFNSLNELKNEHNLFNNSLIQGFSMPFELNEMNIFSFIKNNINRVTFCITEQCNLRCRYCSYSGKFLFQRTHSNRVIKYEVMKRAIDYFLNIAKNKKEFCVSFYGGEPLLAFDLIKKIVHYIKSKYKNIDFTISSNGTLLNKKIINFLISNNFTIYISLDGPKDIHDEYRIFPNYNGSYDKIIDNLYLIKNINEKYFNKNVFFMITVSPTCDVYKLKNFIDKSSLVKHYKINFVSTENSTLLDEIDSEKKKVFNNSIKIMYENFKDSVIKGSLAKKDIVFYYDIFLSKFKTIIQSDTKRLKNNFIYPNSICVPGAIKNFVDADGNFRICEKLDNFADIGNVYNGYNLKKIYQLINEYISFCYEDCLDCIMLHKCDFCFLHAQGENGLDINERRKYCEGNRIRYKNTLLEYTKILEENKIAFEFIKRKLEKHQMI